MTMQINKHIAYLSFGLALVISGSALAHGGFHGGGFHGGGGYHGGGYHGGGYYGHGYRNNFYGVGFNQGYYGGWRGNYINIPIGGYYPVCNTVRVCNHHRCWLNRYCN